MSSTKCVVLVPVASRIEPACEDGLRGLEAKGYQVRRLHGYRSLDLARNQMASDALADGFEELFWIDPDIAFEVRDVERLRGHDVPVAFGIYPVGRHRELSCELFPKTTELAFGEGGGLVEVVYAQLGFAVTHRVVFDRLHMELKLPLCKQPYGRALIPFFAPSAAQDGRTKDWVYLTEDYSFCQRCRRVGIPIMADTGVRIWRGDVYFGSWEEFGQQPTRYRTFTLRVPPPDAPDVREESHPGG